VNQEPAVTEGLKDPIVWVDLEMTGLEPDSDVIIEIAVIVTDGQLESVVEGPDLVIRATDEELLRMPPVVVEMHRASGLTDVVRASEIDVPQAEQEALAFIKRHVPLARSAPLAGNSIGTDRAFLRRHMPELEGYLHYRNVDVSTLKELIGRWYPGLLDERPDKEGGHRAMADIRESINELRWYREKVFRPAG
jgi:oligoribonuclease